MATSKKPAGTARAKRRAPVKYTREKVAEALRRAGGIKHGASRILGIDYANIKRLIRKWPDLQAVCDECREVVLDDAEEGLAELVAKRNVNAIVFILKTAGRGRGYGVRYEVTGADGAPLVDVSKLTDEELRALAGRPGPALASAGGIGAAAPREAGEEPN